MPGIPAARTTAQRDVGCLGRSTRAYDRTRLAPGPRRYRPSRRWLSRPEERTASNRGTVPSLSTVVRTRAPRDELSWYRAVSMSVARVEVMRVQLVYGDVPTWIASIGTVGALGAALIQINTER